MHHWSVMTHKIGNRNAEWNWLGTSLGRYRFLIDMIFGNTRKISMWDVKPSTNFALDSKTAVEIDLFGIWGISSKNYRRRANNFYSRYALREYIFSGYRNVLEIRNQFDNRFIDRILFRFETFVRMIYDIDLHPKLCKISQYVKISISIR